MSELGDRVFSDESMPTTGYMRRWRPVEELAKVLEVRKADIDRGIDLHRNSIVCDAQFMEPAVFSESLVAKTKELLELELLRRLY